MKPNTRMLVEREIQRVESASKRAGKLTDVSRKEIEEIAKKYSKENSSVLAGIVGAVVGAAGGVTVSGFLGATLVIGGPAGMIVGAALAVLSWRGVGYLQLERAEERLDKGLSRIKSELNTLPDDAPKMIKEDLWREYNELMRIYSKIARKSLYDMVDEEIMPADLTKISAIDGEVVELDNKERSITKS